MKKKVLFSIVGIALFAMAIGFGLNNKQEEEIEVKNVEALADVNPACPNGCHAGVMTCFCYTIVWNAREHDWEENPL